MSTLSQFMPGGKPRQVTTYTSGSGTYTPVAPNSWCRITLIGGGGAGAGGYGCYGTFYGGYGTPGQWLQQWTKVVSTASYTVGNAGYWTNTGYPYYSPFQVAPGATSFNGISCGAGGNGGGTSASGQVTSIHWSLGIYTHGSSYGRGGYGSTTGSSNGCSSFAIGGNGVAGFILIEDFGP